MVRNNIELDVKVKCIEQNLTQQVIAERIGTTSQYVNRIINRRSSVMNKTFVDIMDVLGYDIKLVYIPKAK